MKDSERGNIKEYAMDHRRRGKAVIFCHKNFGSYLRHSTRIGAEWDVENLTDAFKNLEFEVKVHMDLTLRELRHTLKGLSEEDHRDADCLVVIVMTHGEDSSKLYAKDFGYQENELWEPFVGNEYCSLKGKPKLFFIVSCRGFKVDEGIRLLTPSSHQLEINEDSEITVAPSTKDLLVAHSAFEGCISYRNPKEGTIFVQALCNVFRQNGTTNHLLELLTAVNDGVADFSVTVDHSDDGFHGREIKNKQMPNFFSTLSKLVYFRPKQINNLKKSIE